MNLFEYNQRTYNELLTKLFHESRVGVVQCTGSGKGAIATKLITEGLRNYKILLLAPRNSILTNYLMSFGITSNNRVQLATYQGICSCSEEQLNNLGSFADVIILDEYHRCGAEKWGKAVNILINAVEKHNGKVIGFTATPKRYLDNERDMTQEVFNGVCIEGVDLTSAIKKGILPVFTYVKARYGYSTEVNEYRRYCRDNKAKGKIDTNRLALVSDNDKYIHDIVVKETKDIKGCQKWIVFCSNIKELREISKHIPKWFDTPVNILESHSKLSEEEDKANDYAFRNAKKGINLLLTVEKYNEGVHLKDISGVIMLRQTLSPIIFLQQLGRALSAGNIGQRPIIFDFVSNIESIQNYEDLIMYDLQIMADDINAYAERKAKKDSSKGGKIILKSYCEDVDKVLADIAKVVGVRWSENEDNIIREYFPTEKKEVYKRLQGRTQDATYQRARYLGLIESREWSRAEDNIIRKYYPIEGTGVVVRLDKKNKSVSRTEDAIKTRAAKLGVKKDKKNCWTDEDDLFLKRRYANGKADIEKVIRILGGRFTTEQIYTRLKYLGFNYSSTATWTNNEDALLYLFWGHKSMEEIERMLPRHTRDAIIREASYLGLEKGQSPRKDGSEQGDGWTHSDKLALIELYNEHGKKCFDLFEPRTPRAVEQQLTNLRKDLRYKDLIKRK